MKEEFYINLSGIYDGFLHEVNCKDISGTNCYCDDVAWMQLEKRFADIPVDALRFMDSGNYHYLSYFFLNKIKEDFALVLFDHHPDFQMPSFGEILSCGGWVKNAWEDFPNLKKVYMVGVDASLFEGLKDVPHEVQLLSVQDVGAIPNDLPIYISIDKDVLSGTYAACDWDQGNITLSDLIEALYKLLEHRILGADVCGEKKEQPTTKELQKNKATNEEIRKVFLSSHFMV